MNISEEEFEFIISLQNQGYNIVKLEGGDLYLVSEFIPSDRKINPYHSLRGKRITEISSKKSVLKDIWAIITFINTIKEYHFWIHGDIKYLYITSL